MSETAGSEPREEVPEWVREALTKANNEAAKYRTEKNAALQAHTEATENNNRLTDEKAALEKSASDSQLELLKLKVALDAKVPGEQAAEFASRLRGDTEDDLKADAANALKLFGSGKPARATDPSQGRGDSGKAAPSTPKDEFAQVFGQLGIFKK